MATAYPIGIDLHRTVIQICVLDERGSAFSRVSEARALAEFVPGDCVWCEASIRGCAVLKA